MEQDVASTQSEIKATSDLDREMQENGSSLSTTDEDSLWKKRYEEKEKEVESLNKRLSKAERMLEKANTYNEDLRKQLSDVSCQLHDLRNKSKHTDDFSVQVSEVQIEEEYGEKPMPVWEKATSEERDPTLSIAESLKAAAEAELKKQEQKEVHEMEPVNSTIDASSEYVYDAASGFYFHPSSGYYWDPNSSLFYDYTTGCYYQYDAATGEYTFHSQVCQNRTDPASETHGNEQQMLYWSEIGAEQPDVVSLSSQFSVMKIDPQRCKKNALELAENYPPCIRVIVDKSDHLTLGALYIITCMGGSLGRGHNMGHIVEMEEINASQLHARIDYDYTKNCYFIIDKGSQNGTKINGSRLSKSKCESKPCYFKHDDRLEIGKTVFLLHIHKGNETCENCEPGQIQAKLKAQNTIKNDYVVFSKEEKNKQRRQELKKIKKKYGLQNADFEPVGSIGDKGDYCDKAYLRRKYVGSDADIDSRQIDQPSASVDSPIGTSNKGHKLLAKMGWKEGEGLGKSGSGIAEPIQVEMRINQSAGLGSSSGVSVSLDNVHNAQKAKRWSQARERFEKVDSLSKSVSRTTTMKSVSTLQDQPSSQKTFSVSETHPSTTDRNDAKLSSFNLQHHQNIPSSSPCKVLCASDHSIPTVQGKRNPTHILSGFGSDCQKDAAPPDLLKSLVYSPNPAQSTKKSATPKISWIRGDTQKFENNVTSVPSTSVASVASAAEPKNETASS